ncbi:uncharacterized protein LOC120132591 [Hibiscus syriacus]|uniref:uncharacterized protein LOC120132591 n=1 Tax=Hibiscus syriacus TaxID=106335 RepID=UPI001922FEA7|nr:uncharacterized protein LOC120132591 [Hibiscus syriacus]
MAASKEEADWTNLPKNIQDLIAEKSVPSISRFVQFCLVCKTWLTTIMESHLLRRQILKRCHRQVPLLMIPIKDKSSERRVLYDIIDKKRMIWSCRCYNRRCCGSSYGWIATIDHTLAIKLINPFNDDIINLPSVDICAIEFTTEEDEYEFYVKKVILSDDPCVNPNDFMVLALFECLGSINIIRPGEKSWTYTTSDLETIVKDDVIFVKGKAYPVDWRLGVISVDVTNTNSSSFVEKMVVPPKHGELVLHQRTLWNHPMVRF